MWGWNYLWLFLLSIPFVGIVIITVGWFMAPEGYEDETGFHYGRKREDDQDESDTDRLHR